MKLFANNTMEAMSRKARRNAMNAMMHEAEEILNTFDYSNYEIEVFTDDDAQRIIIPKPVFALSLVDENLRDWILGLIDQNPDYYNVVIA